MKQRYRFVANSSSASYTISRFNICDELYEAIKIGKTTFPVKGVGEVLITNKIDMTLDAVAVHKIFKELTEACETVSDLIILIPFIEDPVCYIEEFNFIENQKNLFTSTAFKTQTGYVGFYKDGKYYGELCCNIDKDYDRYSFIQRVFDAAKNLSSLRKRIGDWEFIDSNTIKVITSINSDFTPCTCEFKRSEYYSEVYSNNEDVYIKIIDGKTHYCDICHEDFRDVVVPYNHPIGNCKYSEYK